ncbi:hypothetical protein ACN2WE_04440 [Streptomyces sp. cg28]|uniref:hypothetical protein n=1 Tax=Streptomyces sp. cg28 TaxID=3403457 RepID=UPI003B2246F4
MSGHARDVRARRQALRAATGPHDPADLDTLWAAALPLDRAVTDQRVGHTLKPVLQPLVRT